eukprot:393128_1
MGDIFTHEKQLTTQTKTISTTQTTSRTQTEEATTATKTNSPETDIQIDKVNPINLFEEVFDEKVEQELQDYVDIVNQAQNKYFQATIKWKRKKLINATCDNNHE